ncbi:hypothetical protein OG552_13925 [Streptomyces sp. NBC_01476]|uniref:hypothetical protein n=1 Tax=Streptomyces sp. NBC_01476 TaxID=2903881 RepID=UPI002E358082|nr:hypothetical protein [Streptomyces sp. NBC_01476]
MTETESIVEAAISLLESNGSAANDVELRTAECVVDMWKSSLPVVSAAESSLVANKCF